MEMFFLGCVCLKHFLENPMNTMKCQHDACSGNFSEIIRQFNTFFGQLEILVLLEHTITGMFQYCNDF